MNQADEKISVCLPVYNGASTIAETVQSILGQTLRDFEFVIVDNASTDETARIIGNFSDNRIRFFQNKENLGCGGNLSECRRRAGGDILFYIAADDVADAKALERVAAAFRIAPEIGIVVRPYYWFEVDPSRPNRATRQFSENIVVSLKSDPEHVAWVLGLADQISGVALRRKFMPPEFCRRPFVEMSGMVAPMLKRCDAVILNRNIVAIRSACSGAMSAAVYQESPAMSWRRLVEETFDAPEHDRIKKYLTQHFVARNFVGLVQIKNFSTIKALLREIGFLLKLRRKNIFHPMFLFYVLLTLLTPRFFLRKFTVFYKNSINPIFLKDLMTVHPGGNP